VLRGWLIHFVVLLGQGLDCGAAPEPARRRRGRALHAGPHVHRGATRVSCGRYTVLRVPAVHAGCVGSRTVLSAAAYGHGLALY
jgi:hypothetical protein